MSEGVTIVFFVLFTFIGALFGHNIGASTANDNAIDRKVPPDINQTPTHYAIAVLEHFGVE